jgi:rhodanese-related sulfurtransferase
MVIMVFLLTALAAQEWALDPGLPSRLSENDLARGQALYVAHCQRCHGTDGDDTTQGGITPLGGLSLRLGDPRNRNFGGPSFRARGRIYSPEEARALMGYILTLHGEKGFRRPEGLVSPYLLDRKRARRTYLVIDVRSEAEFRKGHISSAANLPPGPFAALARPALAPDLRNRIVVLYDDGPGLQAAKIWRALFQSGHRTVAILDGGFKRWVSEDREITSAISTLLPATLLIDSAGPNRPSPAVPMGQPVLRLHLDWKRTVTERGIRKASELTDYLRSSGFKGAGRYRLTAGSKAADLLVFQLHLLGFSVEQGVDSIHVQPDSSVDSRMAPRAR